VGICGSEDAALNRRLTQIMRIAQIAICEIGWICGSLRFKGCGSEPQTDADYEEGRIGSEELGRTKLTIRY